MMDIQKQESFHTILTLIQDSRNRVFATVNRTLVELYWRVGEINGSGIGFIFPTRTSGN